MKIWKYIKLCFNYFRIPKGDYCSQFKRRVDEPDGSFYHEMRRCPYWDKIEGRHHQEDGYCHWLEWGDYDKNNDETIILEQTDVKSGVTKKITAPELPFGISLLWDGVKECGLRRYTERDEKKMLKAARRTKNEYHKRYMGNS
jgi:hypothetical protein